MAYNDRGGIRARVIEYLDGRTDLDSKINDWIDDTRRTIASQYYQFSYLFTEAYIDTSAGQSYYPLPCDYMGHLNIFLGKKKLVRLSPNEFDSLHVAKGHDGDKDDISHYLVTTSSMASGEPDYYIDRGMEIEVWPVPDGIYTLFIKYYAQPAPFEDDEDNDYITSFYPELVIFGAAYRGAVYLDDANKMATYKQEFNALAQSMIAQERSRKMEDLQFRMRTYKDFSPLQFRKITKG